jgi:hypothetical protein
VNSYQHQDADGFAPTLADLATAWRSADPQQPGAALLDLVDKGQVFVARHQSPGSSRDGDVRGPRPPHIRLRGRPCPSWSGMRSRLSCQDSLRAQWARNSM